MKVDLWAVRTAEVRVEKSAGARADPWVEKSAVGKAAKWAVK